MKPCLQCGAEVPAEDAFCRKCGHAMKRSAATDATLLGIRQLQRPMVEASTQPSKPSKPRSRRPHQATVLGLPQLSPAPKSPAVAAPKQQELNKTMLGIPRPAELGPLPDAAPRAEAEPELLLEDELEPLPETLGRRQSAFVLGALLMAFAAAWLGYRLLSSLG